MYGEDSTKRKLRNYIMFGEDSTKTKLSCPTKDQKTKLIWEKWTGHPILILFESRKNIK